MSEEKWAAHGGIQAVRLQPTPTSLSNRLMQQRSAIRAMLERSNVIEKTRAPIALLPRLNVCETGTNARRNPKSERECVFALDTLPFTKLSSEEKIQALVQRLSSLEDSVRTTHVAPEFATPSVTPDAAERPTKRRRTASSVPAPRTPDVDTTQQPASEARTLISKELSTNGLLSGHQRKVLETAITFVDHLSHAPAPTITDRSTFDKSMHNSIDLSPGEVLHVILASEYLRLSTLSRH
jgi:hypothetical protein